jgi:hypothetical protein
MQGLHVFDPRVVVAVDLESLVQQDHLLRKVDRILYVSRLMHRNCLTDAWRRLRRRSVDLTLQTGDPRACNRPLMLPSGGRLLEPGFVVL